MMNFDSTDTNLLILMLVFALLIVAALAEGRAERRDRRRTKALADRQRAFWHAYDARKLPWTEYKR